MEKIGKAGKGEMKADNGVDMSDIKRRRLR